MPSFFLASCDLSLIFSAGIPVGLFSWSHGTSRRALWLSWSSTYFAFCWAMTLCSRFTWHHHVLYWAKNWAKTLFKKKSERKVRPQKSPRHVDPSPYESADLDSISRPPSAPFEVSSWQRWQRIASLGRLLYWDDQDHLPMGIWYGTSVRCTNFPEICAVLNLHLVYTTDGCSFLESLRSSHNDIWMCIYLPTDPPIHAYHIQVLYI